MSQKFWEFRPITFSVQVIFERVNEDSTTTTAAICEIISTITDPATKTTIPPHLRNYPKITNFLGNSKVPDSS